MKASQENLEGLHVLLVSEDEARTLSLRKALLEHLAVVGDVQSSPEDPVSLRGADVLIVDTRTAQTTQPRVAALRRAGVARWASVVNLDFAKVVPDDGAVQFDLVAQAIVPVTAADRALTERARREETFITEILPLGPTRILRALSKVGATLHIEIAPEPGHTAQLTLSNDLLVGCVMQEGATRTDAWAGLAKVLALTDAEVRVNRRPGPSTMNIMEPLDQALHTAARQGTAAQKAAPAAAAEGTSAAKPSNPFQAPVATPAAAAPAIPAGLAAAVASAKDMRVQPGRTMMGIAPTALAAKPPATPPAAPSPAAQAQAPAQTTTQAQPPQAPAAAARPPVPQAPARPQGAEALRGRTMMGIAPGALGAFGVRMPPKQEPAAEPAAPAPQAPVAEAPAAAPVVESTGVGSGATAAEDPALLKTLAPPDLEAAEAALGKLSLTEPDNSQRELLPTMRAPAPSEHDLGYNDTDDASRVERITRPLIPDEAASSGEITTAVTQGEKMEQLMQEAARLREDESNLPTTGSTLGDDFAGFAKPAETEAAAPAKAEAPAPAPAKAEAPKAAPPAQPKPPAPRVDAAQPSVIVHSEAQEDTMYIERPKTKKSSRGGGVGLLLAAVVLLGGGALYWTQVARPSANATAPASASAAGSSAAEPPALNAAPSPAVEALPEAEAAEAQNAEAPSEAQNDEGSREAQQAEAQDARGSANAAAAAAVAAPQAAPEPAKPAPEVAAKQPAPEPAAPAAAAAPAPAADLPDSVEGMIKEGNRLLGEKQFAQAKDVFSAAVQRDAKNAHVQAGLGQSLLGLGQPSEAIAPFEAAIRLRPKRAVYRVLLGDALKAQGKLEDARAAWEKALEIDPNDRDANKRLAK